MLATTRIFLGIALAGLATFQSCTCSSTENTLRIDGSSTVFVISEAVAEEYKNKQSGHVSVSVSGTGGGFKKLCSKRVDMIGASRSISKEEQASCAANSVEYLEIPIAYDGIVVAVNKGNDWLHQIPTSMLKKMFEPQAEGLVTMWSDVDTAFPKRKFEIFAPGISSGTYDYFTKVVVGKEHSSRGDITTSEDDNVLVHGVKTTPEALGFFSFAYFLENKHDLKALAIVDDREGQKKEGVLPSQETIRDGTYKPLSRTIYLYVNKNINDKARNFVKFYVENSARLAKDVGFIPLSDNEHTKALALVQE